MARKRLGSGTDSDGVAKDFNSLRVFTRGGARAPHKPLLVLWALGQWESGRRVQFTLSDVEEGLGPLLREFGPPRPTEPRYPFIYLPSDGVWRLDVPKSSGGATEIGSLSRAFLKRSGTKGGFPPKVLSALEADPNLAGTIAGRILDAHFPPSLHGDILASVGLERVGEAGPSLDDQPGRRRDPRFRELVLRTYERKCAVCGLDVSIGGVSVLLEASHIRWFQADGPDTESNGLALCPLHHKMFDFGCFTLTDEHRICVSDDVTGGPVFGEVLGRYDRQPIRPPQRSEHRPDSRHVGWHRKQVFKGRPR